MYVHVRALDVLRMLRGFDHSGRHVQGDHRRLSGARQSEAARLNARFLGGGPTTIQHSRSAVCTTHGSKGRKLHRCSRRQEAGSSQQGPLNSLGDRRSKSQGEARLRDL